MAESKGHFIVAVALGVRYSLRAVLNWDGLPSNWLRRSICVTKN